MKIGAGHLAGFVVALICAAPAPAGAAPERVVSMNVCTDQLAMLIADPGQLVSVSYLARDPASSVLAGEARAIPVNHGLAEEIFLLQPDLVLAGAFTTRTTVSLLKRLGFRVEEFAPENDFGAIRGNILRMGHLLGRPERAGELIERFDAELARWRQAPGSRGLAASYYAGSYTSGDGTLADEVISAAGYDNLGAKLGFSGTMQLSLEVLLLSDPDLLILGDRGGRAPALAQGVLAHPALERAFSGVDRLEIESRYWVCGAPFTARAVEALASAGGRRP